MIIKIGGNTMSAMCYIAQIKSPRGNVIDEKVFRKKSDASAFKKETEYNSEKRVKLKKTEC